MGMGQENQRAAAVGNPLLRKEYAFKGRFVIWTDILKYLFSLMLLFFAFRVKKEAGMLITALFELGCVLAVSNLIHGRILRNIVSGVLHLLFNCQMLFMYFAGTYLSLVMITNVDSFSALSGKMMIYLLGAVMVVVFSLLPIHGWRFSAVGKLRILALFLAAELVAVMIFGNSGSPYFAYGELIAQEINNKRRKMKIKNAEDMTHVFYREDIVGASYEKPEDLPSQPNIILIFTEGLSQNVISDERNIMPYTAKLQEQSLNFINYYNHTFATYRGLIGQLFSGYQLENTDPNHLISLQSIFSDEGYHTTIINTEPNNVVFRNYLNDLGFDRLISEPGEAYQGETGSLSDKEAFEKLYEVAEEESGKDVPFFVAMYTFGTHVSLDSPDEVYGDGSLAELNKFYNLDCQFQTFMEKFEDSRLADNTILIFTTDHASYQDKYYLEAFPDYERQNGMVDQIPLFFYYKGIKPETFDAEGRNSLGLAPTVMDYLDLSNPNYFLGSSLFASRDSAITSTVDMLNTVFTTSQPYISTDRGDIRIFEDDESEIIDAVVTKYYIAKSQTPSGFQGE